MLPKYERREALRRLALVIPVAVIPSALFACAKKPSCTDESGLSPADRQIRDEAAKYVDQTLDATKRCSGCMQYVAAQPDQCGACKVIKGPVNPNGYCSLFVAKVG